MQLQKYPIYHEWVQTLLEYNNELIELLELSQQSQTPKIEQETEVKSFERLIDFGDSDDDVDDVSVEKENKNETFTDFFEQNVSFLLIFAGLV